MDGTCACWGCTPVDFVLEARWRASRMNVVRILETHLWVGRSRLGIKMTSFGESAGLAICTPVRDGANDCVMVTQAV